MFRSGARGARVSPDPWGSDDDEQITERADDEIEMKEPPRQVTPPKVTEPKVPPKIPQKETKQPIKNDNGVANGGVIPTEPRKDFVYKRNPDKDLKNEELEKYLHARFATSTRNWTPHLGERRR